MIINPYIFGSPISLTYVDSATGSAASITIPAGAQEGDLAVIFDRATNLSGLPTQVTPSGWSLVQTLTGGTTVRNTISYRVLPASPGGVSVTGQDGNLANRNGMFVLRPSRPINSVAVGSLAGVIQDTNPTAQVVASGSGAVGLAVFAMYASSATVSPRTFTPAEDGELQLVNNSNWIKYKIFNASPADVTVDMDDEGNNNGLHSFYLAVA